MFTFCDSNNVNHDCWVLCCSKQLQVCSWCSGPQYIKNSVVKESFNAYHSNLPLKGILLFPGISQDKNQQHYIARATEEP